MDISTPKIQKYFLQKKDFDFSGSAKSLTEKQIHQNLVSNIPEKTVKEKNSKLRDIHHEILSRQKRTGQRN